MIKLNDILNLTDEEIINTRIRFMTKSGKFNPYEDAKSKDKHDVINLRYLVHNRKDSISFKEGIIAIGFIPLGDDKWLMSGIVDVLKDNGLSKPANAQYREKKYNFRLVVSYHKYEQNGIRRAKDIINMLEVIEIWAPNKTLNDIKFPGYDKVNISYPDLKNKLQTSKEWQTALRCRKGVYLITDKKTGYHYVGSAYGKNGIYGRWKTYIKSGYDKDEKENGKYPNVRFKEIVRKNGMKYIQENFYYTILKTFTDDTFDNEIIEWESWWKEALMSRDFGYNCN